MGRRNLEAEVEEHRAHAKKILDELNADLSDDSPNPLNKAQIEVRVAILNGNLRYAEFVQGEIDREPITMVTPEGEQ